MFLATTALAEFWDKQQELLFLGPWCRRADRRQDWEGLRARILPSPWDDRERFHAAAEYLDRRMEEILAPLAEMLNAQLGLRGDPRYWRILLGTWLLHSLHATYDRYIHLSEALRNYPDLQTLRLDPGSFRTPADARQMVDWVTSSDLYNLQIFSQLMMGMGLSMHARVADDGARSETWHRIRRYSSPSEQCPLLARCRQALRRNLRRAQSALSPLLERGAQIGLVEVYCPPSLLWTLCWKSRFKAVPCALPEGDPHRAGELTAPLLQDRRRSALTGLPAADEFMRFWVRSLPENFPTLYLEGFRAAREQALRRLRYAPRTLLSATGWHYSEPLKFLAAELSQQGGRLVAIQHGCGYGLFRSMPMELHERRISDSFLGWEDAPALQLVRARPKRTAVKSRRLLLVTTANPRYPFRFYSAPQAHQLEEYFAWQVRFLEGMGRSLRSRTAIRLHPLDFGQGLQQRLEERFRGLRWDRERNLAHSAARSCLVVVDHPGTPLFIALTGEIPALLFWDPHLWEFRAEAQSHLESFRQAGLLLDDPQAAARAVEEILREGPDRWWNRASVQAARRRFLERYAPIPKDCLGPWMLHLQGRRAQQSAPARSGNGSAVEQGAFSLRKERVG